MTDKNNTWQPLSLAFSSNIREALLLQHHAAQFIALAGNYLIPKKPDDSNTNMEYISAKKMLVGNMLPNGLQLALHLTDLRISILDRESITKKVIVLEGKKKQEVFDKLKKSLSELGVEVGNFINKLHYGISLHELDKGAAFSDKNKFTFIENEKYRHNADIAIKEITSGFGHASSVRIWPHHFDTGSFIPISRNNKEELTKSIGIGWAIPDSMVNEPYYYLSFWSENPTKELDKLKPLNVGEWQLPNWNGAVLKHSEILLQKSAQQQFEMVKSFFQEGIKILMDQLKNIPHE